MTDAHLAGRHRHRHALADQTPRHRVAVGVDLAGPIIADDTRQLAQHSERGPPAERLQPVRLVALEASDRRLTGRAVGSYVCHLTLPLRQVRLEGLPARKAAARDRVLLHVADAALRLALGARPIWRAGAGAEAPTLGKRDQLVVELNR